MIDWSTWEADSDGEGGPEDDAELDGKTDSSGEYSEGSGDDDSADATAQPVQPVQMKKEMKKEPDDEYRKNPAEAYTKEQKYPFYLNKEPESKSTPGALSFVGDQRTRRPPQSRFLVLGWKCVLFKSHQVRV